MGWHRDMEGTFFIVSNGAKWAATERLFYFLFSNSFHSPFFIFSWDSTGPTDRQGWSWSWEWEWDMEGDEGHTLPKPRQPSTLAQHCSSYGQTLDQQVGRARASSELLNGISQAEQSLVRMFLVGLLCTFFYVYRTYHSSYLHLAWHMMGGRLVVLSFVFSHCFYLQKENGLPSYSDIPFYCTWLSSVVFLLACLLYSPP